MTAEADPAVQFVRLIDSAGRGLAEIVEEICPRSWEKNVAKTQLEQALMWARAAITGGAVRL